MAEQSSLQEWATIFTALGVICTFLSNMYGNYTTNKKLAEAQVERERGKTAAIEAAKEITGKIDANTEVTVKTHEVVNSGLEKQRALDAERLAEAKTASVMEGKLLARDAIAAEKAAFNEGALSVATPAKASPDSNPATVISEPSVVTITPEPKPKK